MARKLRIQFEGAIYHVINRGNYRRDVFESAGAAKAFEIALDEACKRHRWRLHAYVIMRNHYHLAVETPEANLVEGMHWLQSSFATRFNRLRSERGHLFQGRYQALLVEDAAALARVVDYLHLNPVRAGIVAVEHLMAFRWSSLHRFVKAGRPGWLVEADWLAPLGLADTPRGWTDYVRRLVERAADPEPPERGEAAEFSQGWAIGTEGWRKSIAKEHSHLALTSGVAATELRAIKEAGWTTALEAILGREGRTLAEAMAAAKGAAWKIGVAECLRLEANAPHRWIAQTLHMGSPNSVRSYLSKRASAG